MSELTNSTAGKNLYLIGFMGVGKSTTGRIVARKLGMEFVDSDLVIETKVGKSVTQIFEDHGVDYFRDLEREFVTEGHPKSGCVVACGGGILLPDGMMGLLQEQGIVICLFARPEAIYERTKHRDTRPILNVENPQEVIKDLLAERIEKYLSSGTTITTEGRPRGEIVKHIIRLYRQKSAGKGR